MEARPIEKVLAKLSGTMSSGDSGQQWVAYCPAHEDAKQSLAVSIGGDDRVVVKCYAGCEFPAIAAALDLQQSDFFPPGHRKKESPSGVTVAGLAFDKRLSAGWLKNYCGLRDDGGPGSRRVLIPYRDRAGEHMFDRIRTAPRAKDGSKWPVGTKPTAYGLWLLDQWRAGGRLIIVEGESDCWAGWHHGYPFLGVPGADLVHVIGKEIVDGINSVYVWREPDKGGWKFVAGVVDALAGIDGLTVNVIEKADVKDPCELHQRFDDGFKTEFDAILAAAAPFDPTSVPKAESRSKSIIVPPPESIEVPAEQPRYPLTDLGNAERFAWQHHENVKYVWNKERGRWYAWDGRHWSRNCVAAVNQLAQKTVRSIYTEASKEPDRKVKEQITKHAMDSESDRSLSAIIKLARTRPNIVADAGIFDQKPHFFNVQNGTIDLRTGKFTEHAHDNYLSQIAPVRYDPDARCPYWRKSLHQTFNMDPQNPAGEPNTELITFMHRYLGYCLTGEVREQIMAIFWGGGSNGKSTIMNVLQSLMGHDYAKKAPRGMLVEKFFESHPTELADLEGTRFMYASEAKEGDKLSLALIKDLTGTETQTGRSMHEDWRRFVPTAKIVLCTNPKPRITATDDGTWRRIKLIPFRTKYWMPGFGLPGPDHLKTDPTFGDKLAAELPGILNWLVAGAVAWYRDGLPKVADIESETDTYKCEEDIFQAFLDDCVTKTNEHGHDSPVADCHKRYVKWTEENSSRPLGKIKFSAELKRRGFVVERGNYNVMTIRGCIIKHDADGSYNGKSGVEEWGD